MMNNQPPLGADEQRLSQAIAQATAAALQDIDALSSADVGVARAVVSGLEAKVKEQLRRVRDLLGDLKHAAEEQET